MLRKLKIDWEDIKHIGIQTTIEVLLSESRLYEPVFVYCQLYEIVTELLLFELRSSVFSIIRTRVLKLYASSFSPCVLPKLTYN